MSYEPKPIELISSLRKFQEILKGIESFNKKWFENHRWREDLTLYHYTTGSGLKGILDSRSIWCSHIKYFSDPNEWVYGEKRVIRKIEKFLEKEKDNNIIEILSNLKDWIGPIHNTLYDIYAACFCKEGNLLSQWRSYSDRGGGYSLGFTFDSDTNFTYDLQEKANLSLAILRKVIYDEKYQDELIVELLDNLIEAARVELNLQLRLESGGLEQMAMGFANILFELIICMKNKVFEKEEEWRLIIFKPKATTLDIQREVEFRVENGILIPYLCTNVYNEHDEYDEYDEKNKPRKIRTFPLNSIRIGPSLDSESERAKHSLNLLKEKHLTIDTDIKINQNIEIYDAGYKLRVRR